MEGLSHLENDLHTYHHVIDHLKEKNIRITESRKAIIAYMIDAHHHPSAEQIYRDLLPEYPSLSLATVYNNLKVLIREGFVTEIKLVNDNTSYFDFLDSYHPHIVCERCGKISDITSLSLTAMKEQANDETDYDITQMQVIMYGICSDCHL